MTSIASLPSLSPFFYDGSAKILKRGFMDDWANLKHLAIRFSCLYRPPLVIQSFQGANVLWAHFSCSCTFGLAKPCEGNERIISPSPSSVNLINVSIWPACLLARFSRVSRPFSLSLCLDEGMGNSRCLSPDPPPTPTFGGRCAPTQPPFVLHPLLVFPRPRAMRDGTN